VSDLIVAIVFFKPNLCNRDLPGRSAFQLISPPFEAPNIPPFCFDVIPPIVGRLDLFCPTSASLFFRGTSLPLAFSFSGAHSPPWRVRPRIKTFPPSFEAFDFLASFPHPATPVLDWLSHDRLLRESFLVLLPRRELSCLVAEAQQFFPAPLFFPFV